MFNCLLFILRRFQNSFVHFSAGGPLKQLSWITSQYLPISPQGTERLLIPWLLNQRWETNDHETQSPRSIVTKKLHLASDAWITNLIRPLLRWYIPYFIAVFPGPLVSSSGYICFYPLIKIFMRFSRLLYTFIHFNINKHKGFRNILLRRNTFAMLEIICEYFI